MAALRDGDEAAFASDAAASEAKSSAIANPRRLNTKQNWKCMVDAFRKESQGMRSLPTAKPSTTSPGYRQFRRGLSRNQAVQPKDCETPSRGL